MSEYDQAHADGYEEGYAAGQEAERKRIVEFVEGLPTITSYRTHDDQTAYRYMSPAMVAAKIRGET